MTNDFSISVAAPREEVELVLASALPREQLSSVTVTEEPVVRDPFAPTYRGDMPTLIVVVKFAGGALASGLLYDVAKTAAFALLCSFRGKVEVAGDPPTGEASSEPDPEGRLPDEEP